jgi:DNA-binding GntR family transcriptional regulator
MILLGGTTLAVPDRFAAAHAEHLEIVKAIAGRDPDRRPEPISATPGAPG